MPQDLLRSGAAWLAAMRQANATTPVTYRRGGSGGVTCTINATKGRSEDKVLDARGMLTSVQSTDWLFPAAELLFVGQPTLPKSGDEIIDVDGTVYQTMPMKGEKHWRWSDLYKITLRVHTKQVAKS